MKKIKLVTLIVSGVQGIALLIAATVLGLTIHSFESVSDKKCYVSAVGTNPDLGKVCLYRGLWKAISLTLVVTGSTQFVFSTLVTCILVFCRQRDSQLTSRGAYADVEADLNVTSDCYIVWMGYRLLAMLVGVNLFGMLVATRAYTFPSFYPSVIILMGMLCLELVSLLVIVGACLLLGGKSMLHRVRYDLPMCPC
ncbi:unnamed protein product [Allacma fusca]|uniref:Uncharacterized protein n=1 Tax=Allacma fusca TaxID=39272 RepID=A0A8J2K4D2_9HEXA|nr:unnamed protein product [Allacma fusca]